jgi:DNA-binding IclR family transcriptional regulator
MMIPVTRDEPSGSWTFLTNHAVVLLTVAAAPDRLVEDIATEAGITRRRALSILGDLEDAGYLSRTKVGRRNRYTVDRGQPMRHRSVRHRQVQELMTTFEQAPAER